MKYWTQKKAASIRGIGWEFTFQSWLDWWGADIDRRGTGSGNLVMMRLHDTGPYSPQNTRKGTPKQNMATWRAMLATKRTAQFGKDLEAERDASLGDADSPEEWASENEKWLHDNVGWGSVSRPLYEPKF